MLRVHCSNEPVNEESPQRFDPDKDLLFFLLISPIEVEA
jgi:hypothetical protein